MNQPSSQCNPELLSRSLLDDLSEQQEEWLASHLDQCEKCQQTLTNQACDTPSWSRIENVLRDEITGTYPKSRGMLSSLVPTNTRDVDATGSLIVSEILPADFAVEFLQPPESSDSIGRLNDIEIRSVIGHGGNGIVLKGYQRELNRLVAVKVMAPLLAVNPEARRRFSREARATAAIVHPNVMPVLTVDTQGQLPYLVMPYVDCESLQQRLDRDGALPIVDVLRIGHQVARGLAAAHAQGLIHRDVKPANILLERNVDRVMLTDFGLARAADDATLTHTGLIAGTPQYMSPEQSRGEAVSSSSDLFSLGSVLYAMCTGRPPFRAETTVGILRRVSDDKQRSICELNSEAPAWLEGIVSRTLAKQPESRFSSAEEVAELLEDCVAHVQHPGNNSLPEVARQLAAEHRRSNDSIPKVKQHIFFPGVVIAIVLAFLIAGAQLVGPLLKAPRSLPAQVDETRWGSDIDQRLQEIDAEANELLQSLNEN